MKNTSVAWSVSLLAMIAVFAGRVNEADAECVTGCDPETLQCYQECDGFDHIVRGTGNFGPEFYFSKDVFGHFSF